MVHKQVNLTDINPENLMITPAYGARAMRQPVPKYEICAEGLPSQIAYDLIHDEAMDTESACGACS